MTIIALAGELEPEGEDRAQQRAAQARVAERAAARNATESVLGFEGGVAAANTPERVARRLDRLSRYYLDGSTDGVDAAAPVDSHRVLARAGALTGENESAGRAVEAIINTSDFIGVRYLDAGVAAARSVGRINISHGRGYGTGFLVSPTLLLTNHHVLPTADKAHTSTVEFDYQDDVDGSPRPVRAFELDPDTFYVGDRDLDFALTAVKGTPEQLQPFGFRSLTEAQGTVVIGEFTTIVQHPRGDKKMIALRENTLVDILDDTSTTAPTPNPARRALRSSTTSGRWSRSITPACPPPITRSSVGSSTRASGSARSSRCCAPGRSRYVSASC